MTLEQKNYLIELLNKEATMDNAPLLLRKQALTKAIQGITSKISEAASKKTNLVAKRDAINDIIVEREATATALAGVIVVEI